MIKLEVLGRSGAALVLKTMYINQSSIISIEEDRLMMQDLRCKQTSNKFPKGFDRRHTLSRLIYSSGQVAESVTVVGSPEQVYSKFSNTKNILRG